MATSDEQVTEDGAASPQDAFKAKLEELRPTTSFAEKLESAGVNVEVKDKPEAAEEDLEVAEEAAAFQPVTAEESSLAAAMGGAKRDERIQARADLEARALAAGFEADEAKELAHRMKPSAAEKLIARQEGIGHNSGAGPADQTPQGIPAASATPAALSPEVRDALADSLGEAPAQAITGAFDALTAQLAEAREAASYAAQATEGQARARANERYAAAVGELAGEFPELVRNDGIAPEVDEAATALLNTSACNGDPVKALRMACAGMSPGAAPSARQTTQSTPSRDTAAPPATPNAPAEPLKPRDQFGRFAQIAKQYENQPEKRQAAIAKEIARVNRVNGTR